MPGHARAVTFRTAGHRPGPGRGQSDLDSGRSATLFWPVGCGQEELAGWELMSMAEGPPTARARGCGRRLDSAIPDATVRPPHLEGVFGSKRSPKEPPT